MTSPFVNPTFGYKILPRLDTVSLFPPTSISTFLLITRLNYIFASSTGLAGILTSHEANIFSLSGAFRWKACSHADESERNLSTSQAGADRRGQPWRGFRLLQRALFQGKTRLRASFRQTPGRDFRSADYHTQSRGDPCRNIDWCNRPF